ncbi:alpha/beta hydrolase [Amycolatopsis orientalis]|uniref:alpha/beta hydrolase n=1 Tax=Amycolatopsis orientalis TaxID=31958 RepID=UPI0003A0EAB8|nr:alpha/beta hydrolase [Amycolatopsis orientalis]
MRKTMPIALAVAVLAGVVTAAPASALPLRWGACPGGGQLPGLQCSTVPVPLDYRDPDGRKIDLAVSRLSAAKPDKRRGVLLVNPGGPGLSGLRVPVVQPFPHAVRDSYDIVGFDPRGIGSSAGLTCGLDDADKAAAANPPYPHNPAEVAKSAELARRIAQQCTSSDTADLLPFVTTANTARDMDRIREALGEKKVSYYGESYGTYLGAVYTTLFPDRSDRVVLDSSLPPEGYDVEALRAQAFGFQTRFPDFASFAAKHEQDYHLGATSAAVTAKYYQLADRLDRTPESGFDGTAFRGFTSGELRNDASFKELAAYWHLLDTHQPLPAAAAPKTDGDRGSFPVGYLGVLCGDSRWPTSVRTYQRNVEIDRARYPMYGAYTANIRACAYWPAPVEPKVPITGTGPADVLMVQNLRDPATPLPGALRTRGALGSRARMVVADQGGHVAYGAGANQCLNDAATAYLVDGNFPARDRFCPAERSFPASRR